MKGPMKGATIAHAKQRRAQHALHRHHRAGHHRRRVAEPDRQPPGDHAGHREAPRSLRAHGPRHHRVPGRRRHRRGNPVPARASCCTRTTPALPFPLILTGPTASARVFRADRPVPAPDAGRGGHRALPDHRRRPGRGGAGTWPRASARCASTGSHDEGRVLLQLGAARAARLPAAVRADPRSDGRAEPAPRPARRTSWPPTCAAPSPASSPATSRKTACAAIEAVRPVRDRRRPATSCRRWTRCCAPSSTSGG